MSDEKDVQQAVMVTSAVSVTEFRLLEYQVREMMTLMTQFGQRLSTLEKWKWALTGALTLMALLSGVHWSELHSVLGR